MHHQVMIIWEVLITVVLAFYSDPHAAQGCSNITARPCCREATPVKFDDTGVHAVGSGSCVFNGTLCSYRPGCTDSTMQAWASHSDYALAYQMTSSYSEDQAVLSSPLLDLRQDICFQAKYYLQLDINVNMDGFLEYNTSDRQAVQLIHRQNAWGNNSFRVQTTVLRSERASFGRVKIRAKAGGAYKEVRLFSVFLHKGRCESPDCNFNTSFCGWDNSGWANSTLLGSTTAAGTSNQDHFAHLQASNGTLTSPLTRAPSWASTPTSSSISAPLSSRSPVHPVDCVRLHYLLKGGGGESTATTPTTTTTLSVSVMEGGQSDHGSPEEHVLWSVRASTDMSPLSLSSSSSPPGWMTGVFPVTGTNAYRIVIRGQRHTSSSSVVALHSLKVTPFSSLANCRLEPPEANIGAPRLRTTARATDHTPDHGAISTASKGPGASSGSTVRTSVEAATSGGQSSSPGASTESSTELSTHRTLSDDKGFSAGAAIGGSVAAVVILIAAIVVVIVVVLVRRKQIRRGTEENPKAQAKRKENQVVFRTNEKSAQPSSDNGDYTEIRCSQIGSLHRDDSHRDVTEARDDVNPYDLPADDEELLSNRPSASSTQGLVLKPDSKTLPAHKQAVDDYSHINVSRSDRPGTEADAILNTYSHLGDADGDYSHVDRSKTGTGVTRVTESDYDHTWETSEDYNHISLSHNGLRPAVVGTTTASSDNYNHIGSPGGFKLKEDPNNPTSGTGEAASTAGQGEDYSRVVRHPRTQGKDTTAGDTYNRLGEVVALKNPGSSGDGPQQAEARSATPPDDTVNRLEESHARSAGSADKTSAAVPRPPQDGHSIYCLQKPVVEASGDDYNTLEFHNTRKESARIETQPDSSSPYDHVQCAPK